MVANSTLDRRLQSSANTVHETSTKISNVLKMKGEAASDHGHLESLPKFPLSVLHSAAVDDHCPYIQSAR